MSDQERDRLYKLLPSIYRQRDEEQGHPLRALLAVIEEQLGTVDADIATLYENLFIETCEEWAVPYIGDLLGAGGLVSAAGPGLSRRAYVANAANYGRRKGVAEVVERVARDLSGWHARAVEYFELLGIVQHVHAVRPGLGAGVDLRAAALREQGTPFEQVAARPDVRRIASGRGRHNLLNVGVFIWRAHSLQVAGAPAQPAPGGVPGRFSFHPLGHDQPLFQHPRRLFAGRPGPEHLPMPLTRKRLAAELRAADGPRSVRITLDGVRLDPARLRSADLSVWRAPAPGLVALDPELGRLAFPPDETPAAVTVSYSYGAPGSLGGGPYDRRAALVDPATASLLIDLPAPGGPDTLAEALALWSEHARERRGAQGLIRLLDNGVHTLDETALTLPPGARLTIEAADGTRPAILVRGATPSAPLVVRAPGTLRVSGGVGAGLTLSGVGVDGQIVLDGPVQLACLDATILPAAWYAADGAPAMPLFEIAILAGRGARVSLERSIAGPMRLAPDAEQLAMRGSIVDSGGQGLALASDGANLNGPPALIERSTIFGAATLGELEGSETIFDGPVRVARQSGMVRYCYLPPGSTTPRAYRCQPEPGQTAEVRPRFTSRRYGATDYGMLAHDGPRSIAAGAESGAELGVFHDLMQPQRDAALRAAIEEYLPFGLEYGLFYTT